MLPTCFTCGDDRLFGDGYLVETRDGQLMTIPVCDACSRPARPARASRVRLPHLGQGGERPSARRSRIPNLSQLRRAAQRLSSGGPTWRTPVIWPDLVSTRITGAAS